MAKQRRKHRFRSELIGQVAERFKALADESRLRLLLRLRDSQCNVSTLSQELQMSQASTSKHLAVLRQVGLIEVTRRGTQAIYRIHDESVFEMCEIVCDGVLRRIERQRSMFDETSP